MLAVHRIANEAATHVATHPGSLVKQLRPSVPDLGAHLLHIFLTSVERRKAARVALHYCDQANVMGYRGLPLSFKAAGSMLDHVLTWDKELQQQL